MLKRPTERMDNISGGGVEGWGSNPHVSKHTENNEI